MKITMMKAPERIGSLLLMSYSSSCQREPICRDSEAWVIEDFHRDLSINLAGDAIGCSPIESVI
jgi:hypothetical protein